MQLVNVLGLTDVPVTATLFDEELLPRSALITDPFPLVRETRLAVSEVTVSDPVDSIVINETVVVAGPSAAAGFMVTLVKLRAPLFTETIEVSSWVSEFGHSWKVTPMKERVAEAFCTT